MTKTTPRFLFACAILAFVQTGIAQDSTGVFELIEYSNDSLGFKVDLPCDPTWQTPTIPGSKAILVCETTTPVVIISSERRSIKNNKELDAYVKKQVQVGDLPYEVERKKVDGHQARRVHITAGGQAVELWVVVAGPDRLHMFSFVSPAGQNSTLTRIIVDSIKLM